MLLRDANLYSLLDLMCVLHPLPLFGQVVCVLPLVILTLLCPSYMQSLLEKGYELVSGGTDNHLVLVNLKNKVCD